VRAARQESQLLLSNHARGWWVIDVHVLLGGPLQCSFGSKIHPRRLSMEQEVERLLAALAVSERERTSERTGRIRAEQALRAARANVRMTALTSLCWSCIDAHGERMAGGGDGMHGRGRGCGGGRVSAGAHRLPAVLLQPAERDTSPGTLRSATAPFQAHVCSHTRHSSSRCWCSRRGRLCSWQLTCRRPPWTALVSSPTAGCCTCSTPTQTWTRGWGCSPRPGWRLARCTCRG
jgi:hypothetical protein